MDTYYIIPIFWGPAKVFISNNIVLSDYAKKVRCDTYIIGSNFDKTLSDNLQHKVKDCFTNCNVEINIFDEINHEDYLKNEKVIKYIKEKVLKK